MAQTLRTHLKKVYKRLLPKEEDVEPPPEKPKVAKKTVADPSFSPVAPYVYKPKARRKTPDYHCIYEKQVYKVRSDTKNVL
ncbi:hypothetical protein SNE40_002896 [Patella caerulea]|uniref:Uncharacterized protein n=1 Tax=Patella caerulea TaxID=87958 RepID=A0AAN8K9H2_PATCE